MLMAGQYVWTTQNQREVTVSLEIVEGIEEEIVEGIEVVIVAGPAVLSVGKKDITLENVQKILVNQEDMEAKGTRVEIFEVEEEEEDIEGPEVVQESS